MRFLFFILLQVLSFIFLLVVRKVKDDMLLFESILFTTFLQTLILITLAGTKKIGSMFRKLYRSPIIIFLLSGLVSFNLLFFSLMMIDRSKSLYVIQWVGEQKNATREEIFNAKGVQVNSLDFDYINLRIEEQIKRKIIVNNQDQLSLSNYGKIIYSIANVIAKIFALKNWNSQKFKTQ
jgi:hypothetical protein